MKLDVLPLSFSEWSIYQACLVVLCIGTLSSYYLFRIRSKLVATEKDVQTLTANAYKGKDKMIIRDVWIYPLKSGHRCSVKSISFRKDKTGLEFDRRFMVCDAKTGEFTTQRKKRAMALIRPSIDVSRNRITFAAEGMKKKLTLPLEVELASEGEATTQTVKTTIWRVPVEGIDCGDVAAAWVTTFLNSKEKRKKGMSAYRLLRFKAPLDRNDDPKYGSTLRSHDRNAFQDGCHSLVANARTAEYIAAAINASAEKKCRERGTSFPEANRVTTESILASCRPNFVVDAGVPFAEDFWGYANIITAADGDPDTSSSPSKTTRVKTPSTVRTIGLRPVRPCGRCVMTTNDQDTGSSRPFIPLEPLVTLRRTRSVNDPEYSPIFGLYFNLMKSPTSSSSSQRAVIQRGNSVFQVTSRSRTSVCFAKEIDKHYMRMEAEGARSE